MLGKLFKYEWKSTSKMGALMVGALAIVTLLGVLGFALPFSNLAQDTMYSDEDSLGMMLSALVSMGTMMVYMMTLMGVVYGMLIYMGVHFYKTMYSDEGYLTHTLPVTPRQLIISKVLNAGIWYGIIMIGMTISIVILMIAMFWSMGSAMGFPEDMSEVWREMLSIMQTEMGLEVVHVIVSLILVMLVSPISAMMTLFGALTIGQLSSKYRAFMGILAYFGVCTINGVISYIISFVFTFSSMAIADVTNTTPSVAMSYDASLITSVIMLVAFYFISHAILTKKLNME